MNEDNPPVFRTVELDSYEICSLAEIETTENLPPPAGHRSQAVARLRSVKLHTGEDQQGKAEHLWVFGEVQNEHTERPG